MLQSRCWSVARSRQLFFTVPPSRALQLSAAADLHHEGTADRALLVDRLVPGREVTLGVALAAEEGAALLRAAFDHLSLVALRAFDADLGKERSRVAAIGEAAARQELAESPELDHHRPAALLADLVGGLVFDSDPLHSLLRGLERRGERTIELLQRRHPRPIPGRDLVQLVFEP